MISVYEKGAVDFGNNGLGTLNPISCVVTETINGNYEVVLTHPIDEAGKYARIQEERIIKVPVPAGRTPRIASGVGAGTLRIYKIVTDGRRLYLRAAPSQDAKGIKTYKPGTEVVVIDNETDSKWSEVETPDGKHGWMWTGNLSYVRTEVTNEAADSIKEAVILREQPFRIYKVEPTLTTVTAYARHIFYDLMDNMVSEYKPAKTTTGAAAFIGLAGATEDGHGFAFYSDLDSTAEEIEITDKNPAEAILGDGGLIENYGGELARDWWDVYLVKRIGEETGIQIREGKNLLGIKYSVDITNCATRIIPKGTDADGKPLYLPEKWVENPAEDRAVYINHKYSVLEVKDAKEKTKGDDKRTKEECWAMMRKAAEDAFKEGADLPDVTLNVDFIDCAETEEYRQYRFLQGIHMGDTVRVVAKRVGVEVSMRMTQYSYNCLTKRYEKMTLGTIDATIEGNMINPRSIGSGTIKGSMIKLGGVGAGQLADGSVNGLKVALGAIEYAHIGEAAINQLSANAITAIRADIRELVAGNITTDQLYADLAVIAAAQITAANIEKANIQWAQIGTLAAEIAKVVNAEIKNAKIDWAQIENAEIDAADIKNLSASIATIVKAEIELAEIDWARIKNVEVDTAQIKLGAITRALIAAGAIGTAQIADGSITSAKIVELSADVIKSGTLSTERLLIKGEGGLFYEINAKAGGLTAAQLTEEQYKNAISGTALVAQSVTADKIAAKSITANEILSGTITAAEINVSNLFAAQATIAALDSYIMRTSTIEALKGSLDIWASDKIRLAVSQVQIGGTNMASFRSLTFFNEAGTLTGELVDRETAHYCRSGKTIILHAFDGNYDGAAFLRNSLAAGKQYTVSFWASCNVENTLLAVNIFNSGRGVDQNLGELIYAGPNGGYYTRTFECPVTDMYELRFICFGGHTGDVHIMDVKLEEGNKATAWSPAPEDTDGAIKELSAQLIVQAGEIVANATKIETVNQSASSAQNAANAAQNAAAGAQGAANNAVTRVTTAEQSISALDEAVRTKVSQTDFNALGNRVSEAEGSITTQAGQIAAKVSVDDFNALGNRVASAEGSITTQAGLIEAKVEKTAFDELGRVVSEQGTKIALTDEQVLILAGRTVGGTNLAMFGELTFANSAGTLTGELLDHPETHYCRSGKVIRLEAFDGAYNIAGFHDISLEGSREYTVSFWAVGELDGMPLTVNIWNSGRGVDEGIENVSLSRDGNYYKKTFTCPVSDTYELRFINFGGHSGFIDILDVKLEEGNTATAWSANPAEFRAGSSVEITEKRVKIVSPETQIGIPAADGETMVAQFDENGLTAERVTAGNIAYRYDGPAALYVNPNADSTQIATGAYYRSLADACAAVSGRNLDRDVTIAVEGDSYGSAVLYGICGRGSLTVLGNGRNLTGELLIGRNTVDIVVDGLSATATGAAAAIQQGPGWMQWTRCKFVGASDSSYGLRLERHAAAFMFECELYNAEHLLSVGTSADVVCNMLKGGGGTNFLYGDGGNVKWYGTRPGGNLRIEHPSFTNPEDLSALAIDYGSAQPSVPAIQTASWDYLYSDSYARGWNAFEYDDDVRQGYNGQIIHGVIWFDAAAIRSTLSGRTIKQASLRLYMHTGVGRAVGVSVQLYGSNVSYDRTDSPALLTSYGTIGTTQPGVVNEITIPAQVITDIVNGTIQALVLKSDDATYHNGEKYSKNYARFSGSTSATADTCPRLTVVYQ